MEGKNGGLQVMMSDFREFPAETLYFWDKIDRFYSEVLLPKKK